MLEAVIVCDGYSDFLAHTLPANKANLDYLVVVTGPNDKDTRAICDHWHVHCVIEPRLHPAGGGFRKGAGINRGLSLLSRKGWLLHLDADIALPPRYREFLDQAKLDHACIYGADRLMVPSFEAWSEFLARPAVQYECGAFVHPRPFPVGVRFSSPTYKGWVPLGYHQLWHRDTRITTYPEEHTDAGRGDLLFAAQWPRALRALIPELYVYHLESEPSVMGTNWAGRRTRRFGPGETSACDSPSEPPPPACSYVD